MNEHDWPTDPEGHLWGPWMQHSRQGNKFIQYRQCVHPKCSASEQREAPKA